MVPEGVRLIRTDRTGATHHFVMLQPGAALMQSYTGSLQTHHHNPVHIASRGHGRPRGSLLVLAPRACLQSDALRASSGLKRSGRCGENEAARVHGRGAVGKVGRNPMTRLELVRSIDDLLRADVIHARNEAFEDGVYDVEPHQCRKDATSADDTAAPPPTSFRQVSSPAHKTPPPLLSAATMPLTPPCTPPTRFARAQEQPSP